MKAQVQEHQQGDGVRNILGEPQRGKALAGHIAPDHLMVVKGDAPAGDVSAGPRLADVVQQGRPAQYLVRAAVGWRILQRDGLLQHGEGMGVDVLVLVVLVDLHPQRGQLGQDDVGDADVDEPREPGRGIRRDHEFAQLVPDALNRYDLQSGSPGTHRRDQFGYGLQPQLGLEAGSPQDAQRVVVEGRLRGSGSAQHLACEVRHAAEQIDELVAGYGHRHGVDGEVPADEIPFQGVTVGNRRISRRPVICLGAVCRHLEPDPGADQSDRAEGDPRLPDGVRPPTGDLKHTFGVGVGGEVEVGAGVPRGVQPAQQRIPDGSADEVQAVARRGEDPSETIGGCGHLEQGADSSLRGVTWVVQADHRHFLSVSGRLQASQTITSRQRSAAVGGAMGRAVGRAFLVHPSSCRGLPVGTVACREGPSGRLVRSAHVAAPDLPSQATAPGGGDFGGRARSRRPFRNGQCRADRTP